MSDRRFIVAKNPDPESSLPYLVWLPIGADGLVLKARETWPRTSKVYCHRATAGMKGGREGIFWQSAKTTRQARPSVRVPGRRASFLSEFTIIIDTRERYAYKFSKQQAEIEKTKLPVGDYGVMADDHLVAVVERKSLADLSKGLTDGGLAYQLADLATQPGAAVVVEERYSQNRATRVAVADRLSPSTRCGRL